MRVSQLGSLDSEEMAFEIFYFIWGLRFSDRRKVFKNTNFSLETVANDRSNLLYYFLLVLTTEVYHNVETEHKMLSITNTDFI